MLVLLERHHPCSENYRATLDVWAAWLTLTQSECRTAETNQSQPVGMTNYNIGHNGPQQGHNWPQRATNWPQLIIADYNDEDYNVKRRFSHRLRCPFPVVFPSCLTVPLFDISVCSFYPLSLSPSIRLLRHLVAPLWFTVVISHTDHDNCHKSVKQSINESTMTHLGLHSVICREHVRSPINTVPLHGTYVIWLHSYTKTFCIVCRLRRVATTKVNLIKKSYCYLSRTEKTSNKSNKILSTYQMENPQNQRSSSYVKITTALVRGYGFSFVCPPHCASKPLESLLYATSKKLQEFVNRHHFLSLCREVNNVQPKLREGPKRMHETEQRRRVADNPIACTTGWRLGSSRPTLCCRYWPFY